MDMTGQEQNPAEVTVASNSRRSNVWEHFTPFRTGDGKSKAKCKKCNRVLAAETRNGTSHLRRHVLICCKRLGGSETDVHESNQLTGSMSVHYDQTTLPFGYEMPASSRSFPSDLQPTPQQLPLLPPALQLGEPSRPHGSSDHGASGVETADVGAARPRQPMLPPTRTLSLSLPGSSMQDQDEEVVQKMVYGFEQLCNLSIEKVQDMGAAPICSVEEAASRSGPAGGGSSDSDSDHDPAGLKEAMQQLPLLPPSCAPSPNLQEEACKQLARMIALRGYDASVLEDDCFRSFVRSLNPEFEVPSRVAIEEMCDGIFDEARRDLLSRLVNAPARVSVAVGKAKTIEAEEVLYTACHFIDDEWNLRKLVLQALVKDTACVPDDGPILGVHAVVPWQESFEDEVLGIVFEHDIQDRLSMVAYDDDFHPEVKDYIEVKINCHTNLSCSNTTFVDNLLHEIAGCLLPCSDFSSDQLDAIEDLTRQTRQQLLSHCGLDNPWTYNKSWYSCYCSIKVILQKGYNSVDVGIASLLCKVWGTIHQAIQRIFSSISNICLLELFNVRKVLHSELAKACELPKASNYCEEYADCLVKAINTLDKAIQDSYLIWSVPFLLDPRYKRELLKFCFERAFGSEEAAKYVSEVTTRINELYDYYIIQYGKVTGAGHSNNAMIATTSAGPLVQAWNEQRRQQDVIMVDQVNCTYPETQTELHRYLQDLLVPWTEDFDILDWWKVHNSKYPTVALMVRDALAWPTCSKLSSDQSAQVKSMIRGYSEQPYRYTLSATR